LKSPTSIEVSKLLLRDKTVIFGTELKVSFPIEVIKLLFILKLFKRGIQLKSPASREVILLY